MPDLAASLSNGAAVRADVVARLLGLRLLKLHAEVILVPATTLGHGRAVESSTRPPASVDGASSPATLARAHQLLVESDEILGRAAVAGHD